MSTKFRFYSETCLCNRLYFFLHGWLYFINIMSLGFFFKFLLVAIAAINVTLDTSKSKIE